MLQIIENYIIIFVIPFFIGFGVRLMQTYKRGYKPAKHSTSHFIFRCSFLEFKPCENS